MKSYKGTSTAVFDLKKKVTGTPKEQTAVAILHPDTNKLVTEVEDITKVSLEYCKQLLRKRSPKEEFVNDIQIKDYLHEMRMAEYIENDLNELTELMFMKSWDMLKKSKLKKYKFEFLCILKLKDLTIKK